MMKKLTDGWKVQNLGEIVKVKTGNKDANASSENGIYPFFTCANKPLQIDSYCYSGKSILLAGNGDLSNMFIYDGPFDAYQRTYFLYDFDSKIDYHYLFYHLKNNWVQYNENKQYGSVMNYIKMFNLTDYPVFFPPLFQQEKIVTVLDTASQLVEKQKALIEKYDLFLKSKFIEMFGDPVLNPMGWEVAPLKKFGKVITGNTPSRKVDEYYNDDYIEWIKTDNISPDQLYVSEASEYLSEEGMKKSRVLHKGALLTTCIAGSLKSIGNACLTDRTVCFNQQINAIQPNEECHPLFLYAMFTVAKSYIQTYATSSMKKIITKGEFEKIEFIKPPFELQGKYAAVLEKVYVMKAQEQRKLEKLQTLYDALMQRAFNGEIE